jgi:hypothetical protein
MNWSGLLARVSCFPDGLHADPSPAQLCKIRLETYKSTIDLVYKTNYSLHSFRKSLTSITKNWSPGFDARPLRKFGLSAGGSF